METSGSHAGPSDANSSASPGLRDEPLPSTAALPYCCLSVSRPSPIFSLPDPDRVSVSRPVRLHAAAPTPSRENPPEKMRPFVWPCVCCASRREAGVGWGWDGWGWGAGIGERVQVDLPSIKSLPRVQQSVSLLHHRWTSKAPRTSAPSKHGPNVHFFSVSLLWQHLYTLIN